MSRRAPHSGYDIADYRGIAPEYGDMATFDTLVREVHARTSGRAK